MCTLEYSNKYYDHSDCSLPILYVQLRNMAALYNRVEVTYYPAYVPNEQEIEDPLLFAENVREYFHQQLKWPKIDLTLKDKYYFLGKHKDFELCSELFQRDY